MPYEVLVVDDNISAAREYARLIQFANSVEASAVDNPDSAIELLKSEPIRVVVLDQRMPGKKGTELYKELKAVDSKIKVMMLSGQAETQELDEATKLGYNDYLHKSRIKELPSRVHALYVQYESDLYAPGGSPPIPLVARGVGIWPFREKIEYFLSEAKTIQEEYVFPDSWLTVKQISAGETVSEDDMIEVETRFKYQSSLEAKAGHSGAASVGHIVKLQSKIETTLSSKFSSEVYRGTKRKIQLSRVYKLPEAPPNPRSLHVASRHFQRAPVYREIRALIARSCSSCGTIYSFPIVVYQPTSKIATRHVDYLSDGSEKTLATGCEKF
jgi:DNA-binding response OmpR family regulator